MRAIPYLTLLQRTALLFGMQPDRILAEDEAVLGVGLTSALRRAWEFAFWPECTTVAEYRYRADYSVGTAYAAGDQVWDPATAAYYQAVQSSTGQPVSDPAYWSPLGGSQWDVYVPWGGAFLPEGATIRRCLREDPRVKPFTPELDYSLSASGVHPLRDVPATLFVEYRQPCPDWSGSIYAAAATYAPGDQIYFGGDYHRCLTATAAGENPTTTPAKWSRLEIPWRFGDYAIHCAAADKYRADAQLEKAVAQQSVADDLLYTQLVNHEAQSRQQRRFRL